MIREFQIKQELRRLNKVKKDLRKGTDQYKEVKNKIKELKLKLVEKEEPITKERTKLIAEIESLTESFFKGMITYKQFSMDQLKLHLTKLQNKRKINNEKS